VDSHRTLPRLPGRADLAADLAPFRALASVAPAVMVSHAAVGTSPLPASLDPGIATDLLRGETAFDGVAVSDDLEMGALAGFGGIPERSAAAFSAGCDLLCIGKRTEALAEAAAAVERAPAERRTRAARRVAAFRATLDGLKRERRLVPRAVPEIAAAFRRAADRLR
jgi:beta-N-acetylhexosaminidase